MARLEIEKPVIIVTKRRRVQDSQCPKYWMENGQNEDCWEFQDINGNFFCLKKLSTKSILAKKM